MRRNEGQRNAGQQRPGCRRVFLSRASARSFTQVMLFSFQKKTPRPSRSPWGVLTDYFGASSVASALDLRTGRDPGANHSHTNITFLPATHQQDISMWPVTGHFYLALTRQIITKTTFPPEIALLPRLRRPAHDRRTLRPLLRPAPAFRPLLCRHPRPGSSA